MARPLVRPSTMDAAIWDSVWSGQEYGECGPFRARDIVIDIGAHIGAFAAYALARGAGFVMAYDADARNVALARQNLLANETAAEVHLAAVGRSDRPLPRARVSSYPRTHDGLLNTGGVKVSWDVPDGTVPSLAFDRIVERAARRDRSVRLLKLDCEGSEWPILYTSRRLDLIEEIVGEYHELSPNGDPERRPSAVEWNCTASALETYLRRAGFDVEVSAANAAGLGRFAARRARRTAAA